jgi:hypothetical protein
MVEEFLGDFLAILEMVSKVLKAELEMAWKKTNPAILSTNLLLVLISGTEPFDIIPGFTAHLFEWTIGNSMLISNHMGYTTQILMKWNGSLFRFSPGGFIIAQLPLQRNPQTFFRHKKQGQEMCWWFWLQQGPCFQLLHKRWNVWLWFTFPWMNGACFVIL